jgi:hypothetical protein
VATAAVSIQKKLTSEERAKKYGIGVLAGLEYSPVKNAELTESQKNALKELVVKHKKRDYPARLIEVIQSWEAALFYRGFQFLIPQRGGGWIIPGESTGYGPTMQMDLALLPTNIYSARAQMIIAALTRTVPTVRFMPQGDLNDAAITAAESADKFVKVIARNNDLIMVQTDASRILWNDGRFGYWSRFVKDGQRFGWEEDDRPDDIVPEDEPADDGVSNVEQAAGVETPESTETAMESGEAGATEESVERSDLEENPESPEVEQSELEEGTEGTEPEEQEDFEEEMSQEEENVPVSQRTPRGQEVRTAHGKLEMKISPMMANDLEDVDALDFETEVDVSRAKGMFPWIADDIKGGDLGLAEGEIARLARQNVKLGMQSTYVTSSSMADDVTISRTWLRPSTLMEAPEAERDQLIEMFPNGCLVVYAGETFAYARNESMDDSWALGQAYSGDGQNRNAMGTSTLPIQKRLNNWLDLMNDFFVRAVPKKWMDNKVFNVEAIRGQTNVPGDIGGFKRVPGTPVTELILIEPQVLPPPTLADFIKEYSGPLAELLSGAYPALAGGDVGTADSGVAIATQRDSALGRLAPTWHSIKNAEATSMKQLVRWGAKCRDKSINEKIPGGEVIKLEINDLKGNILCYAESDENFPETFTQRQNKFMQTFDAASKNAQLAEVLFNGANLDTMRRMTGNKDIYIPQATAYNKQLGEIDIMQHQKLLPNPMKLHAQEQLQKFKDMGVAPEALQQAQTQIDAMPDLVCSIAVDPQLDDNKTEMDCCWRWLNEDEGRKAKKNNPKGYANVRQHFLDHQQALQQQIAQQSGGTGKPPSVSINYKDAAATDVGAAKQILQKAGITPTAGAEAPPPVPAPAGAKAPSEPIPQGAPEGAGGTPKL